jgi:hypothetical protein
MRDKFSFSGFKHWAIQSDKPNRKHEVILFVAPGWVFSSSPYAFPIVLNLDTSEDFSEGEGTLSCFPLHNKRISLAAKYQGNKSLLQPSLLAFVLRWQRYMKAQQRKGWL